MSVPTPGTKLPASERLRRAGIAAWSIIGLIIVGICAVWVLFKIRVIFPPLVLALLIIYLLNPLVSRLEQRRVPRTLGTFLSYVFVLGGVTLIIIIATPFIAGQAEQFSEDWPTFKLKIVEFTEDVATGIEDRFGTNIDVSEVSCLMGVDETTTVGAPTEARCDEVTEQVREQIVDQADRITEIGFGLLEGALIFILAPLLALYLLIDLPQLQRNMLNIVPPSHREEVADLSSRVGQTVGGFFRGQLFVAFIVGVLSAVGFRIVGLPFWLVIGALAGFTNLIPLVGPFIGGGLGFLVGTVSSGIGLGLRAALVALIVQQVDNHIISPNVMKRTVQIHPVTVMLSLLAGGTIAGFWGVLLGVPAVAVVKVVASHVWATRVLGVPVMPHAEAGGEPPSEGPEEPPPEENAPGGTASDAAPPPDPRA